MSVFASADQLYRVAEALFSRVAADNPRATAQLLRARLLIRIVTMHPSAEIWIQARKPPLVTLLGHQRLNADLEVRLAADTLHEILRGRLTLTAAVAGQSMQVKGQVWKARALADLFEQCQAIYPHVLHAQASQNPAITED